MSERLEIKASISVDDAGTITGTAWPFGTPDRVNDVIEKGAFGTPARLPMLWAHDQAQAIGVWDAITETDAGLTVKGRLLIDDVARACRAGELGGRDPLDRLHGIPANQPLQRIMQIAGAGAAERVGLALTP